MNTCFLLGRKRNETRLVTWVKPNAWRLFSPGGAVGRSSSVCVVLGSLRIRHGASEGHRTEPRISTGCGIHRPETRKAARAIERIDREEDCSYLASSAGREPYLSDGALLEDILALIVARSGSYLLQSDVAGL